MHPQLLHSLYNLMDNSMFSGTRLGQNISLEFTRMSLKSFTFCRKMPQDPLAPLFSTCSYLSVYGIMSVHLIFVTVSKSCLHSFYAFFTHLLLYRVHRHPLGKLLINIVGQNCFICCLTMKTTHISSCMVVISDRVQLDRSRSPSMLSIQLVYKIIYNYT